MSALSRRNLFLALGGLAAASAAPVAQALPAPIDVLPPIGPRPDDPIFAAMEQWIRMDQMVVSRSNTEYGSDAASAACCARRMLARTVPVTLEGVAALHRFIVEQSAGLGRTEFFFEGDELSDYALSLTRAAARLARA